MFGIRGRVIVCKVAADAICGSVDKIPIHMTFKAINICMTVGKGKVGMCIAGGLPTRKCGMTLGTGSRNL